MNGKKAEFSILNVSCDIEYSCPKRQCLNRWLFVIIICVLITLVTLLLSQLGVEEENMTIVMMVGVLLSTIVTGGYLYGIVTSVLITLSFNFFFTDPAFGFAIHDQQDMIMLIFFLLATLICGFVSSRLQQRAKIAQYNETTAQMIYSVTEHFLNTGSVEQIVESAVGYITTLSGYNCSICLDENKFSNKKLIYSSSGYDAQRPGLSLSIRGATDEIGNITFNTEKFHNEHFDAEKFIRVVIYQMALVLDREYMAVAQENMRMAIERERLKTTLLRSISHDIRTPLTAITGASSTILDNYSELDDASICTLVSNINEEATWLSMTVQNILDLTRFNAGEIKLSMEYEAVDDLISQAVSRIPALTAEKRIHISYPPDILMVKVDGRLFVQVLLNLLDNAYKHAGSNAHVEIDVYKKDRNAVIDIKDDGCGIDPQILPQIFFSFTTMERHRSDKGRGVGLGLAICKAIIEEHGGTITACNLPSGGAMFRINVPMEDE